MDDETRQSVRNRLRRLHGQLTAIERMVDEDRECTEILTQMAAVEGALARARNILLSHHVKSCVGDALAAGDKGAREVLVDDLLDVLSRHGGK